MQYRRASRSAANAFSKRAFVCATHHGPAASDMQLNARRQHRRIVREREHDLPRVPITVARIASTHAGTVRTRPHGTATCSALWHPTCANPARRTHAGH